jgi:hypothetical protein
VKDHNMKTLFVFIPVLSTLALAPAALAQKWEVGGGAGGSFFTSETVTNPAGNANASLANGLAASFWVDNQGASRFGGEFRYDYENSGLTLSSNGTNVNFGADTHAVHYDLVMHFASTEARIRPFVAAGGGVKLYRGIGKEEAYQPLSNVALLTKTNQVEALVSVGGGIKVALSPTWLLRFEVHDYLTPFPSNLIAPAQGSKVGGWLQDFVAMVGISAAF